jgi:hypothetical protein
MLDFAQVKGKKEEVQAQTQSLAVKNDSGGRKAGAWSLSSAISNLHPTTPTPQQKKISWGAQLLLNEC